MLRLRLAVLMLLAAIGLQAALPAQAGVLDRQQGPAWSAWTLDVAVAPARKAQAEATVQALTDPFLPATQRPLQPAAFAPSRACAHPAFTRPQTRGPPPRQHPARVPDCMAPPLS
ncbi:hypothetical protein [Novosphingobium colocasiae]|uniref:hypothetical protein n=1 Tax=Novosphingobium colocasiae TaxID=1256513 RepID=UPI0035B2234D